MRRNALALLALTLGVTLAACRQDMHDAPRYEPLEANPFFANGSASRGLVANTVARGQLNQDRHLYEGVVDGRPAETFPMPVTADMMARGHERYDVFCSPCHGKTGVGNGMIVQRGFRQPPSFHDDRLRNASVGYFFDVMTRGFGAMQDYAAQVPVADRWAIAAYIRALQTSRAATLADVPADRQADLDRPAGTPAEAPRGAGGAMSVDTTFNPPAELGVYRSKALVAGGVGLAICAVGFVFDAGNFFRTWLIAYMLFLGIALGSTALIMIQHLSGGSWGIFRRVFEASSRTLPLLAVLFLPIALGVRYLYPWADPLLVSSDHILIHRAPYLNLPFWIARAVVYFAGWITLSQVLSRLSRIQDTGDLSVNQTIQRVSGAGLVFYGLSITFAGIDWIMALNPHWYSTLFGFLMIAGQGLSAFAFTIVISRYLVGREPMSSLLKASHFHDLGKLMFAFVMLWAYFNFSQYMLTYAANLVEEIPYMITRINHGWQYLGLFLAIFHFAVPWLVLLSRDLKRTPHRLVVVAAWLLLMRYLDLSMMISPEFAASGQNLHFDVGEPEGHIFVTWLDLAAPLGIGGVWLWMFFTQLSQRPLLAVGDPYLRESLQSSGGH